jgi:hypothetical protein
MANSDLLALVTLVTLVTLMQVVSAHPGWVKTPVTFRLLYPEIVMNVRYVLSDLIISIYIFFVTLGDRRARGRHYRYGWVCLCLFLRMVGWDIAVPDCVCIDV